MNCLRNPSDIELCFNHSTALCSCVCLYTATFKQVFQPGIRRARFRTRGNIKTRRRHEKRSLRTASPPPLGLSLTPSLLLLPLKRRFSFRLRRRHGLSLCYFCANETSRALISFLALRLIEFLPRFRVTFALKNSAVHVSYAREDITKQECKNAFVTDFYVISIYHRGKYTYCIIVFFKKKRY